MIYWPNMEDRWYIQFFLIVDQCLACFPGIKILTYGTKYAHPDGLVSHYFSGMFLPQLFPHTVDFRSLLSVVDTLRFKVRKHRLLSDRCRKVIISN